MSKYEPISKFERSKKNWIKLNNPIKIDWGLYSTLLYKQSPSGTFHEDNFSEWLQDHVHAYRGTSDNFIVETDSTGNIYVTKGVSDLYRCVVAHIDTAQSYYPRMKILRNKSWVMAIDLDTGLQVGPGHDDKSGVYLCLEMLKRFEAIKVVFFRQEEVGCVGSSNCDPSFFEDCSMILQQDRNAYNGPELITYTNGIDICSDEFVENAEHIINKYGYVIGSGTSTDVGAVKKYPEVTCVAMNSCAAYYDEHTSQEVLSVPGFENCVNFAYELLGTMGAVKWEHVSLSDTIDADDDLQFEHWKKDNKYYGYEEDLDDRTCEYLTDRDRYHPGKSWVIAGTREFTLVPYENYEISSWGVKVFNDYDQCIGKIEGMHLPKNDSVELRYQQEIAIEWIEKYYDCLILEKKLENKYLSKI